MENDRHYFFVGVFVTGVVLALLAFTIWLSAEDDKDYVRYHIRFAESVSGLSVGGVVKFRGVNVGSVDSITIDQRDTRLIKVDIKVVETTPIKTDTVASLKMQGVTGVVFVELSGGSNEAPRLLDVVAKGDVPEIKSQSSPLNAIVDRMPELLDRISKGAEQVNKMVSDENVAKMSNIISEWEQISVQLSEDMEKLGPLLNNGSEVAENLNKSSQQLNSLMVDLKKTSRHISNLAEDLDEDPSRLIFPAEQKGVPAP